MTFKREREGEDSAHGVILSWMRWMKRASSLQVHTAARFPVGILKRGNPCRRVHATPSGASGSTGGRVGGFLRGLERLQLQLGVEAESLVGLLVVADARQLVQGGRAHLLEDFVAQVYAAEYGQ